VGTVAVTVTNPAPGGGTSNAVNFTITSGTNPAPTIFSLSPTSATPGDPAFTLTVFGSDFVGSSVVEWNGGGRPTTVISSIEVEAQIPASDVAAAGTAAITVFNPAPGGGTSNAANFIIADGIHPASVAVAPDPSGKFGKFAYVANAGSDDVSMYIVDSANGTLTSIGRIAAGVSPRSIAIDPSGKFVYVVNPGSNNVSMYGIDAATGALTSKATIAVGPQPGLVAVDPSGKFAYVADPSNVSMFTINPATGALASIGTIAAGVGLFSSSAAVDPSGKFVYVTRVTDFVGVAIGAVSMYTIDATTGALTSIGSIAAGIDPASVAVDPSSKFTYVTNLESGDISMYGINAATGALTLVRTISTAFAPTRLAIHPSGKFAYAMDSNSSNVFMYTIDATTGDLTSVGTIGAGASPSSIAIDPSGKFAYVTNYDSRSVSMYRIDGATGALTLIGTIGT
jgi:YVTN family beta-propeller protein